jgi:hypothetical protein
MSRAVFSVCLLAILALLVPAAAFSFGRMKAPSSVAARVASSSSSSRRYSSRRTEALTMR